MKEVAKFSSGLAANQVLTHGAMAISGTRFTLFGINYDPGLNTTAAIVWAAVLVVVAYYAWGRQRQHI